MSLETSGVYIKRLVEVLAAADERACLKHDGVNVRSCELLASIHRFARALDVRGIGPGDLVAISATNCPDALAVRYGANLLGAAATFLSGAGTSQARAELIETLDPRLLVVFPETASFVPATSTVQTAGVGFAPSGGFDLKAAAAEQSTQPLTCRAMPHDLAVIISSGGSTGVAKGSSRTFGGYSTMVNVPSPTDRRQLVNGPLAYLSQVLVDMTLLGGGTVIFRERYDATDTLETIASERITDLFLVEPQLFDLMDHPQLASTDLSSLRALTHIGASAPPTLRRRARERFGPRVVHAYGASEEGLVSILTASQAELGGPERLGSAGPVLPGVEVRLRRTDGTLACAGEIGSIEVRSPAMAMGYRNRPELEALVFQDGWYLSGDLGRLDADGYLQVLGHAVDVSFVDGRVITSTQIEDTLCGVPGIRYASVVFEPASSLRVALVLPQPGAKADPFACVDAVAATHGAAVARSLIVVPCEVVPMTPQGKPDREAIRGLGRAASSAASLPANTRSSADKVPC